MKKTLGLAALMGTLLAAPLIWAEVKNYGNQAAQNRTRVCIPVEDGSTQVSTSTSNAQSGELEPNAVYYLSCDADTHINFGTAAETAATTDFLLPTGTVFPFGTGTPAGIRHAAFILSSGTGTCWLLECM